VDKLVVDSCVVLKWISPEKEKNVSKAVKIYRGLLKGELELHAPFFLLVEVANILFWKKRFECQDIRAFIERLTSLGINFSGDPVEFSVTKVIDLMCQYKITSYDAQFLYLAQQLDCRLVSEDRELVKIKNWVVDLGQLD